MKEAISYIKRHSCRGFSEDEIRSAFKSSGWPSELIDEAFNLHETGRTRKQMLVSVGLILFIFCGAALVFYLAGGMSNPTGYAAFPLSCLVQDKNNPNLYNFVASERVCCNLLIHSSCEGINALDIRDASSRQLLFSANVKCDGSYKVLLNEYTSRRCTDITYDNQDILNL